MRYIKEYAIATFIAHVAWGCIYSFSTRYIAVELGGGTDSVILLMGLSWLFTLAGLSAGKLTKAIGERNGVLIGALSSIPILLSITLRDPIHVALSVSSISLPWVISWSVILKTVFGDTSTSKPGLQYSKLTVGTGVGYFAGSLTQGFIYSTARSTGVFATGAILVVLSYVIYYTYYPSESGSSGEKIQQNPFFIISKIYLPLLSVTLIVFTRELLYSMAPLKLDSSIGELIRVETEWIKYTLYGLVFSGGALLSPFVRIWSGILVDRYGALKIYLASILGYLLLFWSFNYATGLLPILLWQIPLFPLLDTSMNVYFASLLKEEEMITGFGVLNSFVAIGGSLITPLLLLGEIETLIACTIASVASISSGIIILLFGQKR